MLISVRMGPIVHIKFGHLFQRIVTFGSVTRVGGGQRRNMRKCDMGEGSKILVDILVSDIF